MIVPQRTGELETFVPRSVALEDDIALEAQFKRWKAKRLEFNASRKNGRVWQKDYLRGLGPGGVIAQHRTRLALRPSQLESGLR